MVRISCPNKEIKGKISISGSKSESNRWLILQAILENNLSINNLSNSEDTQLLQKALSVNTLTEIPKTIDVKHAGTAMRFLTAYFSAVENSNVILTGSSRMKNRPIFPLVDALKQMGAEISYLEKTGFPPLAIKGKNLENTNVSIKGNISSQFITALMLIAPKLSKKLVIKFETELTSLPYIEMTKKQLEALSIEVNWIKNGIEIYPISKTEKDKIIHIESDWSSASYWYSIAAISSDCSLELSDFKENGWQGDSRVSDIYKEYFGVKTEFINDKIILSKIKKHKAPKDFEIDLNDCPDIAQTLIISCAALRVKTKITGLQTLKIKETDRLIAMRNELKKIGVEAEATKNSIEIKSFFTGNNQAIKTYNDHRMALSFATFGVVQSIDIQNENVVIKSYPNFWKDMIKVGFKVDFIDDY